MKKLFSLPENASPQALAALQSALLILIAATVTFLLYLYLVIQAHDWQFLAMCGICLGVIGGCIVCWQLTKRGRHVAGVRVMLGTLSAAPILMVFILADNIASIVGAIIVVVNILVAIRTLTPQDLSRITFFSLIAIGIVILVDIVGPQTRASAPFAATGTAIAGSCVVLFGAVFIIREFRNLPLTSKLLLTFLAITIIPFFILGFLFIQITGKNLTDTAGNSIKTLANFQGEEVGGVLADEEESLRLLAINPVIDQQLVNISSSASNDQAVLKQREATWKNLPDDDPLVVQILSQPIAKELNRYLNTVSNNIDVFATDKYGVVVAATRRPLHYYVGDQEWWQKSFDDGEEDVYITQPEIERSGDPLSISFNIPIIVPDSTEVIGVLHATYSMEKVVHILEQESSGTRIGSDILLPGGKIFRVEGDIIPLDNITIINLNATKNAIYSQFYFDDGFSLVSQAPITTLDQDLAPAVETLNWRLVHDVDPDDALASLRVMTEIGIFSGLGVLLLVALIALWLSRRISSPIIQLTQTAQRIADGDLNEQAKVTSTDEIGLLGTTFNIMTKRLGDTLEEVQQQATALQSSTKTLSRQALQLQAAADVSRAVSSELNANELIGKVVELVRNRFDLYYVGLFLLDPQNHFAVLQAGTGDAGRQMLANGYRLEVNENSMIGWSINHKEARVSENTGKETVHFRRNSLLPKTNSELALPLIGQGQVIGAMTLQSELESAFSPEDISILQTMVDQLANGIEKARLYGQIQQRTIELDRAKTAADAAKEEADQARVVAEEANRSLGAQMWQTSGQAMLNDKMRGEQDTATLAHNVIQYLCKYLEIHSGAVYTMADKVLRLTGTYAYQQRSFAQEYKLGEDLVGEAAVGKEIISNEIPEDYITSELAKGKILARFRLIVPMIYNQEVSGVVALESMREFTAAQERFMEQAIESVAIAFMTAQARARVNELLSQTRQQAEELQAQEEELRAANEELEAQAESLRASRHRPNSNMER